MTLPPLAFGAIWSIVSVSVIGPSIDEFYYLSRIALVKDEANFDKFDRAFAEFWQGVETIPGIGPITASLLCARMGNGSQYTSARAFAASLGLVPAQHSTGGRSTLLGMSKRGDPRLRSLLVQCARSWLQRLARYQGPLAEWVRALTQRRHGNTVACALANKLARRLWVAEHHGTDFDPDHVSVRSIAR